MTVIDEKPVSLYVKECSECGSKFTYKKVEVGFGHNIYCPVCGKQSVQTYGNFCSYCGADMKERGSNE